MLKFTDVHSLQKLPLETKILYTQERIHEWYEYHNGNVCVALSGGKDSMVLRHLVLNLYPDVTCVFSNTGVEFPEIQRHALKYADKVIKPNRSFKGVLLKHGYPFPNKNVAKNLHYARVTENADYQYELHNGRNSRGSFHIPTKWHFLLDSPFKWSHKCCDLLKINPFKKYFRESGKYSFVGTLAKESFGRLVSFSRYGCNRYGLTEYRKISTPLAIWTVDDIYNYTEKHNIELCSIYTKGYKRTGCVYCLFGCAQEKSPNRFELLKITHPKMFEYAMEELDYKNVLPFVGVKHGFI